MESTGTTKRDRWAVEDAEHEARRIFDVNERKFRLRVARAEFDKLDEWYPFCRDYQGFRPEGV